MTTCEQCHTRPATVTVRCIGGRFHPACTRCSGSVSLRVMGTNAVTSCLVARLAREAK